MLAAAVVATDIKKICREQIGCSIISSGFLGSTERADYSSRGDFKYEPIGSHFPHRASALTYVTRRIGGPVGNQNGCVCGVAIAMWSCSALCLW